MARTSTVDKVNGRSANYPKLSTMSTCKDAMALLRRIWS
jgi:hypothetical protein